MARVCVVGSLNMDLVFGVDALPRPGETVLASSLTTSPGGKGANQAVAAARAGAQVQFVGAVGSDPAAETLLTHLRANRVGTDGVVAVAGPSGTATVVVDAGGENVVVVAPGANGRLTLDSGATRTMVARCDVLLVQLEIPVATATAAAREARAGGATVIVNASPVPQDSSMLAALAELTDVVVVNQSEAPHCRWPVEHRVVTLGARGASYTGGEGEFVVPAPTVDAVDTAGAGDVFAGVLATEWAGGIQRALRYACTAAALATLVPGAGACAPRAEAIRDAVVGD